MSRSVSKLDFKYSEPGDASDLTVRCSSLYRWRWLISCCRYQSQRICQYYLSPNLPVDASHRHELRQRKYALSTANAQIWDVASVQSVLDSLSHRAFYITRSCQDPGHDLELTEKDIHFDTKFSTQPIQPAILAVSPLLSTSDVLISPYQQCKTPQYIERLGLPGANPLIPASNLSPFSESSLSEVRCYKSVELLDLTRVKSPTIVVDGPIRVWLARPEDFNIPKVHVWIDFRFRRSFATAKGVSITFSSMQPLIFG